MNVNEPNEGLQHNPPLELLAKKDFIEIILSLKKEITSLNDDFKKLTNLRFYHLERNQNMHLQYGRRDSIEIVGIPQDIQDDKLEDEVIDIFKEAEVRVNRQTPKQMDIQAVHRLKNKNITIVKMVNRKFAKEALICGKNLRDTKRYVNKRIFINDSFCPEFRFLNFAVRKALKSKEIYRYKVRNGINYVQMNDTSGYVEIGHANDLVNINISVPERNK